jgi:hypothetical protein
MRGQKKRQIDVLNLPPKEKNKKTKKVSKKHIQTIKSCGNINNVVTESTKCDKIFKQLKLRAISSVGRASCSLH